MFENTDNENDEVVSAINTTPLVDVMLVLLIIFLITIPVATHTVKVNMPVDHNHPTITKNGNVVIAITANGEMFWNTEPLHNHDEVLSHLSQIASNTDQPQIQIRGDAHAKYDVIGQIIADCQKAGIRHLDFITQQPHH